MLNKEEIEQAKECLKETIQNTYAEGKAIKLNNALKYIGHLESREQKLIEKLEEDIKKANQIIKDGDYRYIKEVIDEAYERLKYANEILSILKED